MATFPSTRGNVDAALLRVRQLELQTEAQAEELRMLRDMLAVKDRLLDRSHGRPSGAQDDDGKTPSLFPGESPIGSGGAESLGGGRAPFSVLEAQLEDSAAGLALDEKTGRLMMVVIGEAGGYFARAMFRSSVVRESTRVRIRTMNAADLVEAGELLVAIAPGHARYLRHILKAKSYSALESRIADFDDATGGRT